jgi:hypothetical protein
LLFAPTPGDLVVSGSRGAARAAELAWPEADVPRPYPRSSPFSWRRRFHRLTALEFAGILLACSILMVLAGVVVRTHMPVVGGGSLTPPATTHVSVADADDYSRPESAVEIEDDHPPPLKQVPSLDDPPT